MSVQKIVIVSVNAGLLVALMSVAGIVIAGPNDSTRSANGQTQSTISLVTHGVAQGVAQEITWWSPAKGSDELKWLFSEDRDEEESQGDSMAEILREDPLQDETAGETRETESDESRGREPENEDDESASKPSVTQEDRLTARLASLRKPASSLTLAVPATRADESGTLEPINRAAVFLSNQPSRIVEGSFDEIVRADRMPMPFCHRPTYFQELNLERAGQVDCQRCGYWQNAYSSVWFLTNAALLPYRIATQPPNQCVGGYGDCRTCQKFDTSIEPLCDKMAESKNLRGTLLQAASMAGFVFLIW